MRINKFIANNSNFSRRKVDQLILEGQVFVNGEKITEPGIQINPEKDKIKIFNKEIQSSAKKFYLILNKPAGYITTRKDEQKRQTVMDLIPQDFHLKPVGRLDKDTEGLLIFTNDGELINELTHPKFHLKKEYLAIIEGKLKEKEKENLENGIVLDNKKTLPAKIEILEKNKEETRLKITIREGRKRQIRKMFAYFHHPVKYLRRERIGKLILANLPIGKHKFITKKEIQ